MRRASIILTTSAMLVAVACVMLACSGSDDKDKPTPDATAGDSRARPSEPFGTVCDNPNSACKVKDPFGYKLVCIALKGGTAGQGYCSRTCSDVDTNCFGVPNGQMAGCFVETSTNDDSGPGTKYCGFICKSSKGNFDCPPKLKCGKPNAQGTAVCLP